MHENKVIKSSIIVMGFVIIGKVLAVIRDMLIAAKFGTTYNSDIYMFSIGLVYLLTGISYGVTATFIPVQAEHIEKMDKEKNNKFVNNVLNISLLFTLLLTAAGIIFSKNIVATFAPGFTKEAYVFEASVRITRIMLISLFFISAQSVLAGVLQAHKHFYVPAAMATASNIIYILYLVLFAQKYGIVGFAWATVIGFFVQFAINVPEYNILGYKYSLYIDFKNKELQKMLILMIPVIISTSTTQLNLFVNRYFATIVGEGAVSALDYSNKLNTLVDEVFATSISMVIFPILASFAAQNNEEEYKRTLLKSINSVLLIMIPAAIATAVLRYPLITVLFKRGAFDDAALKLTAGTLLFYCPAMIANGTRGVLNKAFYSIKDTSTPMINSLIGIVVNGLLSFFLVKYMKTAGLTLAASVSIIITTIFLIKDLNKSIKGLNVKGIMVCFGKVLFASLLMGAIIYVINKIVAIWSGSGMKGSLISLIISFVIGSAVYFLTVYLLRVEECTYALNIIKKKFIKSR
jgi:putative peptidoglycan lipid II flippase